jgi:hypothetical protein
VDNNPYPSTPDRFADSWFQALDQRRVVTPRNEWDILVTGVHAQGSECWIQMADANDERKQLLLRVSKDTTVEAALEAVKAAAQQDKPIATALV